MVVSLYVTTIGGGGGGTTSMPDIQPYQGSVTSVPPNAETTVVSRVVPGGYTFKLHGIVATGNAAAEWILYDNGVEQFRTRTSPDDRGVELLSGNAFSFATGHTVALKVQHTEIDTISGSTSRNFQAALLGRDA